MKNLVKKVLGLTIDRLSIQYRKRISKAGVELPYKSLSPTKNAEKVKDYLDTLEWALQHKDEIRNIAVAGPYGSGKSSVIRTFQEQKRHNKEYKFLNISLATFKEESSNESNEEKNNKNDILRLIELSILQQLFYHEKDSNIPDSRFKKIKRNKRQNLVIITLSSIAFLISFLYLVFPSFLSKFYLVKIPFIYINLTHYLASTIILIGCVVMIYKSIRALRGFTIKKFGISNATIEIDKTISKSILNNHIDEILYFFEVTPYNVVILEDLDRFRQTDVFTKLREINLLINNSKKIDRDIAFIYAIKDDMFQDNDRTKFFDFIMPIIPVINSSNSSEKLLHIIHENSYDISSSLIEDISLFIDDMRLLYNIMNEYHVYSRKLNTKLIQDKLLSMIVYKNIYPSDFKELSQSKGELFQVISNRHSYIQEKLSKIEESISMVKEKIKEFETVKLSNLNELRLLYISKLIEHINRSGQAFRKFHIGGKEIGISEAIDDKYFSILKDQNSVEIYNYTSNAYFTSVNYDFTRIEDEIDPNYSYEEREELILGDSQLNKLKQDLENREEEKNSVRKEKLRTLIENKNIAITTNDQRQNDLIHLLLRNGYIDEDYLDYISIFYEGSLSKNDHQFLINVKTQTETEFDFSLQKKENLVKRIGEFEFEKEYILNYDLVEYLLSTKKYTQKRLRVIIQLANESDKSINFIDGFISKTTQIEAFIRLLCREWINIWHFIESKANYTEEKIGNYFKLIINHGDVSSIEKIFKNDKQQLSRNKEFQVLLKDIDKSSDIIKALDLKFEVLNESISKDLLDFIYQGNHYELTHLMIGKMLKYMGELIISDFETKNFTTIVRSGLSRLIEYIQNHINKYISNVYLKLDTKLDEDEEYLIQLLNNDSITIENKEIIIVKNNTLIRDANTIEQLEVLNRILENSKLTPSWDNLIHIYTVNENNLNEEIISFINVDEHAQRLASKKIKKDFPNEDIAKSFLKSILLNSDIKDESYSLILNSVPYIYNSLDFGSLSFNKVKMLIVQNILITNAVNYGLIKETHDDLCILLIENNPGEFIKNLGDFELENTDIKEIIKSKQLPIHTKDAVIKDLDEKFLVKNFSLLTQIGKMVLENEQYALESTLLELVLNESLLSTIEKIRIFNLNEERCENVEVEQFLESLGKPYSIINQKGKRPLLEDNGVNRKFVEILEQKKYIKWSKVEKKGIRVSTFMN